MQASKLPPWAASAPEYSLSTSAASLSSAGLPCSRISCTTAHAVVNGMQCSLIAVVNRERLSVTAVCRNYSDHSDDNRKFPKALSGALSGASLIRSTASMSSPHVPSQVC